MFFILSKILGFFAAPSNLFISIGVLGLLLLLTRFTRLASWLIVTSLVLLAIAGLSPLGNALILPLEDRFPPWDPSRGAPNGIVVLGGAISPGVSDARDSIALDEAAERITATAELARRYPDARIIFSGGSGSLLERDGPEAPFAVRELLALGVAHDRITAEEQSRNTIENAGVLASVRQPETRRAVVAGDIGLSHAARDGGISSGRFSGRSLSGGLADPRMGRFAARLSDAQRRLTAYGCGDPRMGRSHRLSSDRRERAIASRPVTAGQFLAQIRSVC